MKTQSLTQYLATKGAEYSPFDPNRAKILYKEIAPHLHNIKNQKIIHLIGTNAKGSTGRFISLLLGQNAKSYLHFSSPHLFRFAERFYLNGKIIEDAKLEEAHIFLQNIKNISLASYFEYATFLALVLGQECEYIVLEAGLGGEYDSTNVCDISLSVFTQIGIDHKEFLGDSIESIATTKLNAMRKNAIISANNSDIVLQIAKNIAYQKYKDSANLNILNQKDIASDIKSYIKRHNLASFLEINLYTATKTIEYFGLKVELEHLLDLDLPARCQKIRDNLIIDVGHNQMCATALKEEIQRLTTQKVILIYNTYKEKEVSQILDILKDITQEVWILKDKSLDANPRIIDENILRSILDEAKIVHKNIESSMLDSIFKQSSENFYVIFGSFSVVNVAMKHLDTNDSACI